MWNAIEECFLFQKGIREFGNLGFYYEIDGLKLNQLIRTGIVVYIGILRIPYITNTIRGCTNQIVHIIIIII